MDELIKRIVEEIQESTKSWMEIEYARIRNRLTEDGEDGDIEEYSIDMYRDTDWEPAFEVWCAERSYVDAFRMCLNMIVEYFGYDDEKINDMLRSAVDSAKEKALDAVRNGKSEWLDDELREGLE